MAKPPSSTPAKSCSSPRTFPTKLKPWKTPWTLISSPRAAKTGSTRPTPTCAPANRKKRNKPMDLGLKGRVAIVAAASKGLGRAIAEEFAKEGCQVAICARTAADLERAAQEIEKAHGGSVFHRALDVTNADAVRAFVEDIDKKYGRIDICVTNAGGPPAKKFLEIP